jgi:hypothetical protein
MRPESWGNMFNPLHSSPGEIEELGRGYGSELAAALVLASRRAGADREMKRDMAKIVLREIGTAVDELRRAEYPSHVIAAYDRGAREGVRDLIERSFVREAEHTRHAA